MRAKLQALGAELTPAMLQGTTALMASIAAPRDASVDITRDLQYGPDARNRLDVFRRGTPLNVPVLVYVHGGGFVMGDKSNPGSPFYDNFGQWAAQQGWVGVTLTYRLAPAARWPSGPQDMALAVRWLRANIAAYGGDPQAIILVGQSAGGAHVAAYVGLARFHADDSPGVAGAVMVSGILDAVVQPPNQFNNAYFGEGGSARDEARTVDGLIASRVPLLFTVSEFDPRDFQDQAAQLVRAWHASKGCHPPLEFLAGHNHLTPAQTLGSVEDQFAQRLADFVAVVRSA
jgi:triacylglycerol lipase